MVVITLVMIIGFMQKGNLIRNVNVTFSVTSNDMMKRVQTHIFRNNGDAKSSDLDTNQKDGAIITLFTTLEESYNKSYIHRNVIRNWGLLSPDVIPVLFTSMNASSDAVDYARQRNWHIFPVPKRSKGGIPVFRYMFLEAQQLFDTSFYGYVNSDILFNKGLTDTIHGLLRLKKNLTNLLVVGQRRNWKIKWQQNVTELEEIGEAAKSSPMFWACAEDYFISTHNGYPWSSIPDFVVGRNGYDNWMVVTAIKSRIPVVDITKTVTALHQTDARGIMEGSKKKV